jgi:ribonuclease P protein component
MKTPFKGEDQGRSCSFTKAHRILKRADFVRLSENNRKVQNQHFVALYQKSKSGRTRLGITITKRVGNAVIRNQIKRYVREYYRHQRHTIQNGTDINIIAKKQASGIPGIEAQMSLQDLFCKIGKKNRNEGRL